MSARAPEDGRSDSLRPRVAVLLAAFRDARFLPQQLASIHAQNHRNLDLWVSRDCDDREIGRILQRYAPAFPPGRFSVRPGPRKGAAANFLSMAFDPAIEADYFAWCDQDDVWEEDKLARAVAALEKSPARIPALYASRSQLIDAQGRRLGLTSLRNRRPASFANALVESIAGGHTMVLNRSARDLLRTAGIDDIPYHDWWTYMLVTGAGGHVHYDPCPHVRYRLHDGNHTGTGTSLPGRLWRRLRHSLSGRTSSIRRANIRALREARHVLTADNARRLDMFSRVLEAAPWSQWAGLRKSGIYRQTFFETIQVYCDILIVAKLSRR